MNKKTTFIAIGAAVALVILFFSLRPESDASSSIIVEVSSGEFIVDINVTGELEAKNSVKIEGPRKAMQHRIYRMTIEKMIPEGTIVKKGQFVASLDPSDLAGKMKDKEIELESAASKYITQQLDTALEMREKRDELINLKYAVEEKELELDQSQFEPPATIKKTEIALDKAKRAYSQKVENYEIKKQQNIAKMVQARGARDKVQNELNGMQDLLRDFTIMAPEDGMLIYAKTHNGSQIKTGSQIEAWRPTVATLPDLTSMNSKTYVNEVDIRRVKKGQKVEIGLDALPDIKLAGIVTRVANSGQKRPNSDSKVFEVMIELDGVNDLIKPGMTTSNKIFTSVIEESLSVPLESLHNHNDSISYVYVKEGVGFRKQEIQVGETNDTFAQVLLGLEGDEEIYMSQPEENDDEISMLSELNGKRNQKQEKEKKEPAQNQFPRKPKPNS
ncbi:MAG: efflux RND transporter periplasmic adaptor subunit [Cyclobacteriaceae bacterium]